MISSLGLLLIALVGVQLYAARRVDLERQQNRRNPRPAPKPIGFDHSHVSLIKGILQ